MKRIKPEDLPQILTEDILSILAEMSAEDPISEEWKQIGAKLTDEQKVLVHFKRVEIRKKREKERQASLTDEEKAAEKVKWLDWISKADPNGFYGNMGQPETAQEFKNRYGVWPPGYDKNGNKITDSDEKT